MAQELDKYVHENIEPLLYSWLGFMASHMYMKILNPYYIVGWVLWHLICS